MKIVVCDDSLEYLLKIEKLLLKYQELNPGRNFEIEKYSDALKLCNKIQKKEIADVYILDIIMSDTTGIDIGNLLKKTKEGCVIIYITSSDDFALEAYGVHAIRYLLKPVKEGHFFEALDYAMSYTETKKDALYLVKTKDGLVSVPYGKIEYIENVSRILEICLTDGEKLKSIFIRKSFDEEIIDLEKEKSFIKVHKSFLVNMKYIKKLSKDSIIMESGANLPVSKKNAAFVRKEYLLFVSGQYR